MGFDRGAFSVVFATLLLVVGPSCTFDPAIPESRSAVPLGDAPPPHGWEELRRHCQQVVSGQRSERVSVAQCRLIFGMTMSNALWWYLVEFNWEHNAAIESQDDEITSGFSDVWAVRGQFGDCEDHALRKLWALLVDLEKGRHVLLDAGLTRDHLRVTAVYTDSGTFHAVLTLITDRGDYVLDNLHGLPQSALELRRRHGYRFDKREIAFSQASSPWHWERITYEN